MRFCSAAIFDWLTMSKTKTKKVSGVDCQRQSFAYAPNDDPANWLLPIFIPGDVLKSLNAVKTSLYRFDTAKIPDSERERAWFTLYGAAKAHGLDVGLDVDRRTFAAKSDAPTPAAEPEASALTGNAHPSAKAVEHNQAEKDPMIEAAIADADRRATALLRSLGYE